MPKPKTVATMALFDGTPLLQDGGARVFGTKKGFALCIIICQAPNGLRPLTLLMKVVLMKFGLAAAISTTVS